MQAAVETAAEPHADPLEELQVRTHRVPDAFERIGMRFGRRFDGRLHLLHARVDARVKQFFLAREIEVERPFGDAEILGKVPHVAVGVANVGEAASGAFDDRLPSFGATLRFLRGTGVGGRRRGGGSAHTTTR